MHVRVQVIKPASSKLGSARCQWIVVIEEKRLPTISATVRATTSAATTRPILLGPGLIDLHRSAFVGGAVERIDCRMSFRFTRYFDEAKALGSASVTIGNQLDG
jgi:hypothetical protein